MTELTKQQIKQASKIAVKSMKERLKEWKPADLTALENLCNANFIPNKIRNKGGIK